MFQEVAQRLGNCSAILEVVQACSYGACLFGAARAEVTALGLLQQRSLAGSGLLQRRSLARACSSRGGPFHFFTAYCSLLYLLMINFEKLEEEKGRCI